MLSKAVIATLILAVAVVAGCAPVTYFAKKNEAEAEAAFPPEGEILAIGEQSVHAVVLGEGPDLVLIHGASGNTRDFTFEFAQRMAGKYRVIVLDRPGFGWSSPLPDDQGTIFDQARLLQAAAAKLGADKPIVLGHSYGGAVALAWATRMPDALSALVPVSAAAQLWPGESSLFYRVTASTLGGATVVPAITAFAPEERVQTAIASIFEPQSAPAGYDDYVGAGLSLRRQTLRINAQERVELKPQIAEMVPQYGSVTVPTEIVHGDADGTVWLSVHAEPLAREIPGAALTVLPGIGHMPHHADPEAVEAAIDRVAARAGLI